MGARLLRAWLAAPLRDPAAIARRQDAVEELQERISRENNAPFVSQTQEVLVEGEESRVFTGRNRVNKLVHFQAKESPAIGDLVEVRIEKATAWSLQGRLAAAVPA